MALNRNGELACDYCGTILYSEEKGKNKEYIRYKWMKFCMSCWNGYEELRKQLREENSALFEAGERDAMAKEARWGNKGYKDGMENRWETPSDPYFYKAYKTGYDAGTQKRKKSIWDKILWR